MPSPCGGRYHEVTDEGKINMRNSERMLRNSQQLRREMTKEEKHLWYDFLKIQPFTVNRQKIIGPYILDFYIGEVKLGIELDGSQHYEEKGQNADRLRDESLKSRE